MDCLYGAMYRSMYEVEWVHWNRLSRHTAMLRACKLIFLSVVRIYTYTVQRRIYSYRQRVSDTRSFE